MVTAEPGSSVEFVLFPSIRAGKNVPNLSGFHLVRRPAGAGHRAEGRVRTRKTKTQKILFPPIEPFHAGSVVKVRTIRGGVC
jgi:hypothetical protein